MAIMAAAPAFGHDPITTNLTWTKEISRLVYAHCASCHHPGGTAMSLVTYAEARPWAKAIRDQVLQRQMPPWDAVKGVGEFRDDPSLTQIQLDFFVSWVEGGAPEGDPAYLPHEHDFGTPLKPSSEAKAGVLRVTRSIVLSKPLLVRGISPEGPLEVTACLPDKTVERLIWIKDFHAKWNRNYWFREPMQLPREHEFC